MRPRGAMGPQGVMVPRTVWMRPQGSAAHGATRPKDGRVRVGRWVMAGSPRRMEAGAGRAGTGVPIQAPIAVGGAGRRPRPGPPPSAAPVPRALGPGPGPAASPSDS